MQIYIYIHTHTQVVHIYPHTHTYTQSQTEVQIHNHSLLRKERHKEKPPHLRTHTHTRKWCGCRCWCPPQHNKPKCKQCVRSQQAHLNKPYRHLVKKTQFLASKTDTSPRPEMFTCWQWCNNEFLLTCVQDMLDTFLDCTRTCHGQIRKTHSHGETHIKLYYDISSVLASWKH